MASKKAVFLFGAGAVMDWGGPRTICSRDEYTVIPDHGSGELKNRPCCLTHLINAIGYKDKDGECITNKIYKSLISKGQVNVNFETVINVLEDLYTYWSAKHTKESSTLNTIINIDNFLEGFYYFNYTQSDSTTKLYSISIPGFELHNEDHITEEIHPIQKYYEKFLDHVLGGIIGHVSKYSYYTPTHNIILNDHNDKLNKKFYEWMKGFVEKSYLLRMYTLNYDRLFKVLLQSNEIDVFEGFNITGLAINPGEKISPNLQRIISDFTSNVYYNLHGSAYWGIENENSNSLPGYEYYLSGVPESDERASLVEIERGKKLLLTNIITGYQKAQRTAVSPIRQMLSAFDRDCFEAEELYIIGYSYGDEHINDIIRNARKYNTNMKIILVSPTFEDEKFAIDFISHWGMINGMIYKNTGENEITSPDFNVRIIMKRFGEFLSGKINI